MKLLPFNDIDLKIPKILERLNSASRALAELKGYANSIPNQHILINNASFGLFGKFSETKWYQLDMIDLNIKTVRTNISSFRIKD